jgi:hypothetical protein
MCDTSASRRTHPPRHCPLACTSLRRSRLTVMHCWLHGCSGDHRPLDGHSGWQAGRSRYRWLVTVAATDSPVQLLLQLAQARTCCCTKAAGRVPACSSLSAQATGRRRNVSQMNTYYTDCASDGTAHCVPPTKSPGSPAALDAHPSPTHPLIHLPASLVHLTRSYEQRCNIVLSRPGRPAQCSPPAPRLASGMIERRRAHQLPAP